MKGSGLKPLDESKSSDKPVHIFGSNLEDRVVTDRHGDEPKPLSFGTIEETKKEDDIDTIRKRKFDAITGEEDEETVFQGDFNLFSWDHSIANWTERGRGQLKLNDSLDSGKRQSRLIMRVGGTLKLVLNVAIRHKTFRVITSTKTSIRFTDGQTVWGAGGNNATMLRELIDERLKVAAQNEEERAERREGDSEEKKEGEDEEKKDEDEEKKGDNEEKQEKEQDKKQEHRDEKNEDGGSEVNNKKPKTHDNDLDLKKDPK